MYRQVTILLDKYAIAMQSVYLDTAIAIAFIFLLFSVVAYTIQEWWSAIRASRARMLNYAIQEVLNDVLNKNFGQLLYEHPQIDFLKRAANKLPSYMPASNFAVALIDLISREAKPEKVSPDTVSGLNPEKSTDFPKDAYQRFAAGVEQLNPSELKILLLSFLQGTNTYQALQKTIEDWFNNYMDRVSGWYKLDTRKTLRVIAVVLVIGFNVDAVYLVQHIFKNSQLRNALVASAEKMVDDPTELNAVIGHSVQTQLAVIDSSYTNKVDKADSVTRVQLQQQWALQRNQLVDSLRQKRQDQFSQFVQQVNSLNLPIGWHLHKKKVVASPGMPVQLWYTQLLGWAIAAGCISMGAPFWFSLLGRLVQIRRTGVKPGTNNTSNN